MEEIKKAKNIGNSAKPDKPMIYGDLYHVWEGFWDLHSTRVTPQSGILLSEILVWCQIHSLAAHEIREFKKYIKVLDNIYLDDCYEKLKA